MRSTMTQGGYRPHHSGSMNIYPQSNLQHSYTNQTGPNPRSNLQNAQNAIQQHGTLTSAMSYTSRSTAPEHHHHSAMGSHKVSDAHVAHHNTTAHRYHGAQAASHRSSSTHATNQRTSDDQYKQSDSAHPQTTTNTYHLNPSAPPKPQHH